VFTHHDQRIVAGITALIEQSNYVASEARIRQLLRRIEAVGGEGIFSTISESGDHGFSNKKLQERLGLAVALGWYREQAAEGRHLVLSLDGPAARSWLGRRAEGKRSDLLGLRQEPGGALHVDLIEVKSYDATGAGDAADSYPAEQLRAVARVLLPLLRPDGQGDLLVDCRRELLRRQVFQEGLPETDGRTDSDWIETLDDLLDGETDATLNLLLAEVNLRENRPAEEKTFQPKDPDPNGPNDPASRLPVRRIRLSEPSAQQYLGDALTRSEGAADAASEELDPNGSEQNRQHGEDTETSALPEEEEEARRDVGEEADSADEENGEMTAAPVEASVEPEEAPQDETQSETPLDDEETRAEDAAERAGFKPSEAEREHIAEKAKDIYRAMEDMGVHPAEPVDPEKADVGPSIVRYKARLRPGEKVSRLQGRSGDLMRELAVEKEPIIGNLAGTRYVHVDLPRRERQFAMLRPVLGAARRKQERGADDAPQAFSFPAGVTPGGEVRWLHVPSLPHMLVAGSTGSGKSVFLYAVIASLAYLHPPETLRLVLVDPKRTDFVLFGDLPHLRDGRILTDPEESVDVLTDLITGEVERRTGRLADAAHRNLRTYNKAHPNDPMPRIVVVIDEFADLSSVIEAGEKRDAFDESLQRLAQRARNVGIHLIIATQRPTADIVSGTIKANLPCRASFRLGSGVDSRTILDRSGAENLLGDGDLLLLKDDQVERLQGLFLSDEDTRAVVQDVAEQSVSSVSS